MQRRGLKTGLVLFEVCKMRNLPIFSFTNKMDRPSRSPWEIIDELESEFGLTCIPMNWPIGDGRTLFQGVLELKSKTVHLFEKGNRRKKIDATEMRLDDPELHDIIGETLHDQLFEDIEMLEGLIPEIDMNLVEKGHSNSPFLW